MQFISGRLRKIAIDKWDSVRWFEVLMVAANLRRHQLDKLFRPYPQYSTMFVINRVAEALGYRVEIKLVKKKTKE